MTQKPVEVGKLRRYLMGSLTEEESAELESLYFASDELFEELLAVEDDLVDAYVADELTPDEKSLFEGLLRGSLRVRSRVETARALLGQRGRARGALPVSALLLAATVILALGGLWAVRNSRPASEMASKVTPVRAAATPAIVPAIPAPTGGSGTIASFVLAAGLTRDASEATTVPIPTGTETVELRLPLEADAFSSYDVRLRTEAGEDVLERRGLHTRKERAGPVVAMEVAAKSLPPGAYILILSGRAGRTIETLDQYFFRVPAR